MLVTIHNTENTVTAMTQNVETTWLNTNPETASETITIDNTVIEEVIQVE